MLAKFSIDHILHPQHNRRVDTHRSDDPVEAEDYLMGLLAIGGRIVSIKHEGVELDDAKRDQMVRVATERLASRLIGTSLGLDPAAVKHRLGFAA